MANFFKWEMMVLLILKQKDSYGYELANTLKEQTNGVMDIQLGTLYPILYRLDKGDYISSTEENVGHKVKVIYKLEPKGEELLKQLKERYLTWIESIATVMENADKEIK